MKLLSSEGRANSGYGKKTMVDMSVGRACPTDQHVFDFPRDTSNPDPPKKNDRSKLDLLFFFFGLQLLANPHFFGRPKSPVGHDHRLWVMWAKRKIRGTPEARPPKKKTIDPNWIYCFFFRVLLFWGARENEAVIGRSDMPDRSGCV